MGSDDALVKSSTGTGTKELALKLVPPATLSTVAIEPHSFSSSVLDTCSTKCSDGAFDDVAAAATYTGGLTSNPHFMSTMTSLQRAALTSNSVFSNGLSSFMVTSLTSSSNKVITGSLILSLDGDEFVSHGSGYMLDFATLKDRQHYKLPKPPWIFCTKTVGLWFKQTQLSVGFLLEASPWFSEHVMNDTATLQMLFWSLFNGSAAHVFLLWDASWLLPSREWSSFVLRPMPWPSFCCSEANMRSNLLLSKISVFLEVPLTSTILSSQVTKKEVPLTSTILSSQVTKKEFQLMCCLKQMMFSSKNSIEALLAGHIKISHLSPSFLVVPISPTHNRMQWKQLKHDVREFYSLDDWLNSHVSFSWGRTIGLCDAMGHNYGHLKLSDNASTSIIVYRVVDHPVNVPCSFAARFGKAVETARTVDFIVLVVGLIWTEEAEDCDQCVFFLPYKQMDLPCSVTHVTTNPWFWFFWMVVL